MLPRRNGAERPSRPIDVSSASLQHPSFLRFLVGLLRDRAANPASAQVGPVRTRAVGLSARTLSGLVRGRPGPVRGTRVPSKTGWNCGLSCRWPAVTSSDSGFCPCSTANCSLVVSRVTARGRSQGPYPAPAHRATAPGSATVRRRSTAAASTSADAQASCPAATTAPAEPTGCLSYHHAPQRVIIRSLDRLS
jgi:hypothetical protein